MFQGSYRYRPVTELSLAQKPLRHPSEASRFVTPFVGLPLAYVNLKFNSILVPLRATMVRIAVLLAKYESSWYY